MTSIRLKPAVMRILPSIALSLLAACGGIGVDDPANIPKLGRWQDEMTVDSVTLDGRSIPDDMLPENARKILANMRKSEQKCGEPTIRDNEAIEALLRQRLDYQCHFSDYSLRGAMFSGTAHCEAKDLGGFQAEPTVKIDGTVDVERVKLNIQSIVRMSEKTGASNMLVISGRRIFRRLGDC
jgi:hypothetical protein